MDRQTGTDRFTAWRQRAASFPPLDLPIDRARRAGTAPAADAAAATAPESVERRLPTGGVEAPAPDALAAEVLAAWAALLHRLSGSGRFAVAACLDGRTVRLAEVEAGDDPTFAALAERLRAAGSREDVADHDLPLAELPAALGPRDATTPPAVRAAFGCDPDGACDLALTLRDAGDHGATLRLAYRPDLLDRATAERHLERLAVLLAAARERPATPISALAYLPPQEAADLAAWGRGPDLPPGAAGPGSAGPGFGGTGRERRLERLVAAQAAKTPDAPAVAGGGVAWSYAELARRAEGIARRLRRRGLVPGQRVGVLAERRPEMVAALLGTLQAGCAYVPLDPKHPAQRLAFVLADSGAAAVLAHRHLLPALPPDAPPALLLDEDAAEDPENAAAGGGSPAEGAEHAAPDASRLAYLIYTSGSTGRPKGVAIEHRSAADLLAWAAGEFSAAELSGVAAVTSITFDLSVFEIFLPLSRGGAVVLFDDALGLAQEGTQDGARPGMRHGTQYDTRNGAAPPVTLINTVPSAIAELLRLGAVPATVTTVNLAGEPLHRDLVERLHALPHVERVLDLYGPSEDTTYSTFSVVERGAGRPVTIGRPVGGTRVHLVDRRLRPVGVGVVGELCLAGAGLARGYLGRPARTAASFMPDPFAAAAGAPPGSRLYRTGDLARWLPGGRLDFLGRLDHQVKLRGFRIELGEIESALTRQPAVAEAVAVVHRPPDDGDGDSRLVAYWAARQGAEPPGPAVLREALARTLPEYMLPAQWVRLDALPRNANGKIDRKALPAPPTGRGAETPLRAPETDAEAALAAIWRELLSLDAVGADDDLFALGGHSLLATRIAARVRDELGVHLPPADLFEHRTVAALARRVEALRVAGGGDGAGAEAAERAPEPPPLRRFPRQGRLPLAFPQEQVWLIHRLDPANLAYNFQYTVRLRGALELPVLARALTEIVRRHEVLRTTFPAVDGEPVQAIHPPWPARVPLVDLTALPQARREPLAEELAARRVRRSFDVTRLPLLDWTLLRLDPRDHLFVQAEQHFVHDGWSIGVILSEIEALYTAFAAGRPSPLPELPVQYADFALWQRQWMRGEALERQLAYWRRRLADPPPPLELPSDRPRGRRQRFRGDRLDLDVPPALYARLQEVGRREGWTLFMLMLAAFEALLARYTGRDDFLLGSGVANRRLRESEPLIGMIVNTLVLRADLAGEPTFGDLLARVRDSALGLQAHQDLPFETLVAVLQPERDLSRNPLFQHMFSFHDAPVPDLEFAGLSGELVERHNGSAKADYNVIVKPRGSQRVGRAPSPEDRVLRVLWEFSTDLFDRATIERAWGHYLVLLEALVADRGRPVWRAPLLTAAETAQLAAWNDTATPLPPLDLAAEVAARAAEAPERPAVVAPGAALSYGELVAGASRLAARLAAWGVGPESVVAVALPSSPELVTAVLAAATAGAAWLPLDPEHPPERLAYTLGDSGARVLITSPAVRAALPPFAGRVLTLPGAAAPTGEGAPPETARPPRRRAEPDALAYVLYTSGSTGRPKGTGLTRRGLANLVAWHGETYGVTSADRATLVASPAFDASVWELWPYLVRGAALHVPPPELRAAPRELYRWLAGEAITLAFLPTPLAEAMLEEEPPPGLALRALLVGGDRLHRPADAALPFPVVNHYGPTEDTVVTTAGDPNDPDRRLPPPIGRPVANTRMHLLDARREPVPVGVPGEVYVGGAGLARGYLERPGLTAERFVPDPLAVEAGAPAGERLYRTGDLARRLPDGQLDFLGRLDHQVKLRGFRIELGEIEALLEEHPQVRRAAVVAVSSGAAGGTGDGSGAGSGDAAGLAAFVTLAGGADAAAAPAALTARLAERLPGYMVPESIVALAELPLSPTGKVDRRALAERAARRTGGSVRSTHVAPRDHGERMVAEIWAEVLGLPPAGPGVHDDFFALGGHSLRAAKAAARVGDSFGLELDLPALFEHPTVAALAAHVAERLAAGEAAGAIERLPAELKARGVPLSYAQERLWLIDRIIERRSTYHVARAWACRGPLDAAALARALAAVVERHEPLRSALVEVGGQPPAPSPENGPESGPVQRVAPASQAPVPLPVVDLSGLAAGTLAGEERRLTAALVERPFDLARPPHLRAALLRRGAGEHVLALVLHHVVADGWSMPKLLGDLGEAYRAACAGQPARLPELPVHYADFAAWQRARLDGKVLERLETFWRRHLDGAPPVLELPADRPRKAVRSQAGARVASRLDAETAGAVRRLAREHRATPFMALLAGLAALLGRHGGQDDVVIGTPVAGRSRRELDDLVGFFVNTLALRTRLGAGLDGRDPSFAALLGRVRETTLAAFAHQEMPFERLVDLLAPERDLGHSPVFQATLALEAGGPEAPELAGCAVEPLPVERREAHFELTLFARERGDGALDLAFTYDRDLFDAATVERLAARFGHLLAAACEEPERPVALLPLMGEAERRQVVRWSAEAAALVLDGRLQPVPPGVVGELYTAAGAKAGPGDDAARGGAGAPGDWFPDPLAGQPGHPAGGRLRRTGELARWLGDGTLERRGSRAAAASKGADGAAAAARRAPVAPRTLEEERLAALWGELLPVPPASVHDDFFSLGGHSLLASRLVLRVRESFGVELPLRGVFRAPTLAGLAGEIARLATSGGDDAGGSDGAGPAATIRRVRRVARRPPEASAGGGTDGR